jgi:L-asparaginase
VVFTGSMRVHSDPAPDGPANLRDSVTVASSPGAEGVMVCLNGVVHDAPLVNKRTAASVHAFDSYPYSSLGHVRHGEFTTSGLRRRVGPQARGFAGDVGFVSCDPEVTVDDVQRAVTGRRGLVVEGFGDLNVPQRLLGPLYEAASNGVLVMLTSRVFTPTVSNEGLDMLGLIGSGGLPAQKALVLMRAALASTDSLVDATAFVRAHMLGAPEEDVPQ